MSRYKVERQTQTTYLDTVSGDPIDGFEVTGVLFPWVEPFRIRVPSLDPKVVKPVLDELIEQREGLDKLSEPDQED